MQHFSYKNENKILICNTHIICKLINAKPYLLEPKSATDRIHHVTYRCVEAGTPDSSGAQGDGTVRLYGSHHTNIQYQIPSRLFFDCN